MDIGDLTVRRWRRYGKDRLYVERADGTKIGWWDLAVDEAHPEASGDLEALSAAVATWQSDHAGPPRSHEHPESQPAAVQVTQDQSAESGPSRTADAELVRTHEAPSAPDVAAPAAVASRPWIDLATNQPGAEARGRAQSLRAAAPVKTTLARVLGVRTDERDWRIGADGEELVAAQLAKAARRDPRWRFLHAIPVGDRGSDIDHLVIGPGGVFTVNAKHHPRAKIWVGGNTFMVNGTRQPYVRNSRHEASRAARLLTTACGFPVHVEGLIVTVNAQDVVVKAQPDGVQVTWRNNLAKWLLRHGDIHSPEALDAIYEAARRSTTWRT